jgi:hypothetical protein
VLMATQEWSDNCPKIFSTVPPRSGFCKFQNQHLLACNAFSLFAFVSAVEKPGIFKGYHQFPATQVLLTERDGLTRNGMAFALAQSLSVNEQTPSTAMCMHRFRQGTNRWDTGAYWSNENSIPHASIDSADNPGQVMWWEAGLFDRIVRFMNGAPTVSDAREWNGSREQCVDFPLVSNAFAVSPWVRDAVLPEAAPTSMSEMEPDMFWKSTVLMIDVWAKSVGCKITSVRESIDGFVDCSMFDGESDFIAV